MIKDKILISETKIKLVRLPISFLQEGNTETMSLATIYLAGLVLILDYLCS